MLNAGAVKPGPVKSLWAGTECVIDPGSYKVTQADNYFISYLLRNTLKRVKVFLLKKIVVNC